MAKVLENQPVVFGQIVDPKSVLVDGRYKELISDIFVNCEGRYRFNKFMKFADDVDLEKGFKVGLRTRTVFWMWPEIAAGHHFADIKFPGIAKKYITLKDFHVMATAVSDDYYDYARNYEPGYHATIMEDAMITASEKTDFIFYELFKGKSPLYKDIHFENIIANAYKPADGSTNGMKVFGVTFSINELIAQLSSSNPKKPTQHPLDTQIQKIRGLMEKEKVEIDVTKAKIKQTLAKYDVVIKDVQITDDNLEFGKLKALHAALKKTLKAIYHDPKSHSPAFNKTDGSQKDETSFTFSVTKDDFVVVMSSDIIDKGNSIVKSFEVGTPDFFAGMPSGVQFYVRDELDKETVRIMHKDFLNVITIGRYTKYGDYMAYQRQINTGISTGGFILGAVECIPCYNIKLKTQ